MRDTCSLCRSRLSTTVSTTEKPKQDVTAMPLPVSTSTQQSSQSQSTPDPYLTHFDPRSEHQSYKQAQMRLEEVHKEKVTKVSGCLPPSSLSHSFCPHFRIPIKEEEEIDFENLEIIITFFSVIKLSHYFYYHSLRCSLLLSLNFPSFFFLFISFFLLDCENSV